MKPTIADIKQELNRGGGVSPRKLAVWAFFKLNPGIKEAVDWVKEEYGSSYSGHTAIEPSHYWVECTPKGMTFKDTQAGYDATVIGWDVITKILREMVENGEYTIPKPEPRYGWYRHGYTMAGTGNYDADEEEA